MASWIEAYQEQLTLAAEGGRFIREKRRQESFFRQIIVAPLPEEKSSPAPPHVRKRPRG